MPKKLIIAVTGASGAIYAKLLFTALEEIRDQISEAVVIFSSTAEQVWKYELKEEVQIPDFMIRYEPDNFFSPVASGSAGFDTMIVCPCSMGTLGKIASGTSDDLLIRAADVILKEGQKLVLVPRETPFNLIHLENMRLLASAGAHIVPAIPSFYSHPKNINDLLFTVIHRVLKSSGFKISGFQWGEGSGYGKR